MSAPSPLELERYLAGDLDATRADAVERAATEDPSLAAWLEDRRAERSAFGVNERRRSFAQLLEETDGREAPDTPSWFRRLWSDGPSLRWAAVVATVVIALPLALPLMRTEEPGVRTRGGVTVRTAVLRNGRSSSFGSGGVLHPGDHLRISVDDPHGGTVTVLLQDDAGRVSTPYADGELPTMAPGTFVLPDSLALDEALGTERIYVVLCPTARASASWVDELQAAFASEGWRHDWQPGGDCRAGIVHYSKVPAP